MSADSQTILIGSLDIAKVGRFLSWTVRPWTVATFQMVPQYSVTLGALSMSIKRGIGTGAPQAFPTVLTFTSAVVVQPASNALDLSGTDIVYFTVDVVGTSGIVDIYACVKADR